MPPVKLSHLDMMAIGIWLEGAGTSTLLRHVRRLGSELATEADLERRAEETVQNWRTHRDEGLLRQAAEDMRRAMSLTDDELVDAAMDNYGVLPPRWQRLLEEAAERDRRRLDQGDEHRRIWAEMQFGEAIDNLTEQVVRLWAEGGTSRKMATEIIGLDEAELREFAGRLGIEITRTDVVMRIIERRSTSEALQRMLDEMDEEDSGGDE